MPLYAIHTSDYVCYFEATSISFAIEIFINHEDNPDAEDDIEMIVVLTHWDVIR